MNRYHIPTNVFALAFFAARALAGPTRVRLSGRTFRRICRDDISRCLSAFDCLKA